MAQEFEEALNALGAEGWELVQRQDAMFFFKRAVQEEVCRVKKTVKIQSYLMKVSNAFGIMKKSRIKKTAGIMMRGSIPAVSFCVGFFRRQSGQFFFRN